MTTLDDLASVERELRCMADALGYSAGDWIRGNAGTIATFIAAQRGRDADNAKLRAACAAKAMRARRRNYVDASGAVESEVITAALANGTRVNARVPDSWAGKPVLIIPKPKE